MQDTDQAFYAVPQTTYDLVFRMSPREAYSLLHRSHKEFTTEQEACDHAEQNIIEHGTTQHVLRIQCSVAPCLSNVSGTWVLRYCSGGFMTDIESVTTALLRAEHHATIAFAAKSRGDSWGYIASVDQCVWSIGLLRTILPTAYTQCGPSHPAAFCVVKSTHGYMREQSAIKGIFTADKFKTAADAEKAVKSLCYRGIESTSTIEYWRAT